MRAWALIQINTILDTALSFKGFQRSSVCLHTLRIFYYLNRYLLLVNWNATW